MSVSTTREVFYLLAPVEHLRSEHIKNVTTFEQLQQAQLHNHLTQYAIGDYKPAIINDVLFSFFRFTEKQAYLIMIDKGSNSTSRFRRYNFYGLLDPYGKGKIVLSTSAISAEKRNKSLNLTNVLIKESEAFVLELFPLHQDYDDSQDWWMRGVIYEVLLASYQDSNNDGWGDINGLMQRLDYIQLLGVKTIWLTPVYPSPWKDYGYDISNFCDIDPRFGTLDQQYSCSTNASNY